MLLWLYVGFPKADTKPFVA